MDALRHYEFSIIRYVPDIVREEFVNVGVLVVDLADTLPPLVRLTKDWSRLHSLDPTVDLEELQAFEEGLNLQLKDLKSAASFMQDVHDCFSNNLQISHFRARAAESMESLAKDLMTMYVLPPAKHAIFAVAAG